MSLQQQPYSNRGPIPLTNALAVTTFTPPIRWVQVRIAGSGGLVVKDEGGTVRTYAGLLAGDVVYGPFTELTSTTCTSIWAGDGPVPTPPQSSTVADLYQNAQSAQGVIQLPASTFYLLTGAPLAIFANGASAVPGSAIVDSKAFAIRWNNNSTLNGVFRGFSVPADMDLTAAATVHVRASKTGATSGDVPTFDVALYLQANAAADDAGSNLGGTTGAMSGAAAAKTVQDVTLAIAANSFTFAPSSVTITIKPTDGTLGTDDLCLLDVFIFYKKKLLTS